MVDIAGTLLRTTDGFVLLHRRDMKAPTSPGLLGLFGGHAEPGETPINTARRELQEEISLDIEKLKLEHVSEFRQDKQLFNTYVTTVPSEDFEIYEGVGKEKYTIEEALKRNDLTHSARYTLELLSKEN